MLAENGTPRRRDCLAWRGKWFERVLSRSNGEKGSGSLKKMVSDLIFSFPNPTQKGIATLNQNLSP